MTTFVMIPAVEIQEYKKGHFSRVFERLIKPACEIAQLSPLRCIETMDAGLSPLEVIHKLIISEIAICDLSGKSKNVMYELAIRAALKLPIILISDMTTQRAIPFPTLTQFEYDQHLSKTSLQRDIDGLAHILKAAYDTRGRLLPVRYAPFHDLSLKSNEPASLGDFGVVRNFSTTIGRIMLEIEKRLWSKHLDEPEPKKRSAEYFINNQGEVFVKSSPVEHPKFGVGEIVKITGIENNPILTIDFSGDQRNIVGNAANLSKPKSP